MHCSMRSHMFAVITTQIVAWVGGFFFFFPPVPDFKII